MKFIQIRFKNSQDFQSRIASLMMNQKEGESYEFIFDDKEVEILWEDFRQGF